MYTLILIIFLNTQTPPTITMHDFQSADECVHAAHVAVDMLQEPGVTWRCTPN